MLTGRVIALDRYAARSPADVLGRLVNRAGEPVIRNAMRRAMRILGGEFVLGRDIDEALRRGASEHGVDGVFSFDMLGEGARTEDDAKRYFAAYAGALERVGRAADGRGTRAGSGVSVKLSALHPRYEFAQRARVSSRNCIRACSTSRGAPRSGTSVCRSTQKNPTAWSCRSTSTSGSPARLNWPVGTDSVWWCRLTAKRALPVLDWLIELARDTGRSFPVRLVKGAYWDAEIKRAQESGMPDFPVFTQKANTDVAYLACAERLLAARPMVYPQFATHNAHTVAAVLAIAGAAGTRERLRVPAPARHGRTVVPRRGAAVSCVSAGARVRAGRRPSRPARISGAPAARERRELELRESFPRCRYAAARNRARPRYGGGARAAPASAHSLTGGAVRRRSSEFAGARSRRCGACRCS